MTGAATSRGAPVAVTGRTSPDAGLTCRTRAETGSTTQTRPAAAAIAPGSAPTGKRPVTVLVAGSMRITDPAGAAVARCPR